MDTGETLSAGVPKDKQALIMTDKKSEKVFLLPMSEKAEATEKMKLDFDLRDSAVEMNIAPGLPTSLINIAKMIDVDYVTIFIKGSSEVYDGKTSKILV